MERIFKWVFLVIVPGGILIWLIYRAMWTCAGFSLVKIPWNQNNIEIITFWGSLGTEFQEEFGSWVNGKASYPIQDFLRGWINWWIIPYLLVSPGFYTGIFNGKNGTFTPYKN